MVWNMPLRLVYSVRRPAIVLSKQVASFTQSAMVRDRPTRLVHSSTQRTSANPIRVEVVVKPGNASIVRVFVRNDTQTWLSLHFYGQSGTIRFFILFWFVFRVQNRGLKYACLESPVILTPTPTEISRKHNNLLGKFSEWRCIEELAWAIKNVFSKLGQNCKHYN